MMKSWQFKKIKEVCQIKPPKKEAKQKLSDTDFVSFIPMNDLGILSKNIPLNENKILSKVAGSYTYFANNDVLLAKITPCFENGKLGIARNLTNGIGFGSSEYFVFRSKGDIDPEYLFYFFAQDSFRDSGARVMSGAVGHKRVPKEFIENYLIPVPPLLEQQRIVAILDEAFEGIDRAIGNTEKNLANAREVFESYLNGIFTQKGDGWVEKKLKDVCCIKSKLVDPRKPEFIDLPHIGAANIISGTGELNDIKTAREECLISSKYLFDEKMILYSKIRPYLNKSCRPNFTGLCSADVYPLFPDEKYIHRDFLFYLLISRDFTNYAVAGSARTGIPKINRNYMFQYKTMLPSISEQIDIAKKIEEVFIATKHTEAICKQKLSVLEELKQSILQKAFTGELTADAANQAIQTAKEIVAP